MVGFLLNKNMKYNGTADPLTMDEILIAEPPSHVDDNYDYLNYN